MRRLKAVLACSALVSGFGLTVVGPVVVGGGSAAATTTPLINDSFTGSSTPAGTPVLAFNDACLTADSNTSDTPIPGCGSPAIDVSGGGALQLTPDSFSQKGGLLYSSTLPFADGLDVSFTQYQYGSGYPADGIGFVLATAPPTPSKLGLSGGSLGYNGIPGGYLGIGLDVFGNYLSPGSGGTNCSQPPWAAATPNSPFGYHPNTVTVRGPEGASTTAGYCLLTSNLDPTYGFGEDLTTHNANDSIQGSSGSTTADRAASARQVHIIIDAVKDTYSVSIDFTGTGNSFTPVIAGAPLPKPLPSRVTFGWSASTGAADDIHDITNLAITTYNGAAPTLTMTAGDSGAGSLPVGTPASYTLTPGVSADSAAPEDQAVTVTDTLPAGVTAHGTPSGTGWNCSASSGSNLSCTTAPPAGGLTPGGHFPSISVPVTVDSTVPLGSKITNTATATSPDSVAPVSATDTAAVVPSAGFWVASAAGHVGAYGSATFHGSLASVKLAAPIVGLTGTKDNGGYWMASSDGGVFSFGDATFDGSLPPVKLAAPIVGVTANPTGHGYWLVGADGGVFSFGQAGFHGSLGGVHLSAPIVGIAAAPNGNGYWLIGADGGVFSFGQAGFHGSLGGVHLSAPIVGIAAAPNGNGYWLIGADGGVFSFGLGARYLGSDVGRSTRPMVGLAPDLTGAGYWLADSAGPVYPIGNAPIDISYPGTLVAIAGIHGPTSG